uniref:Transmembrane protein 161B n=1 Tax=Rhabditophanes sp. KR3021 TaxID=114890 RepID=A0AC35TU65_9BILA
MALLGFHAVFSLVLLYLFNKFKGKLSFVQYMIGDGLHRFLPPTLEELKKINDTSFAKSYKGKSNNKKNKNQPITTDFKVPKDVEYDLIQYPVTLKHMADLNYYPSLYWLIDFTFFTIFVFICSETFCFIFPGNKDINISLIWLFLTLFFALQCLLVMTWSLFSDDKLAEEKNFILSSLAVFFVGCMILTMFGERFLDINLNQAYTHLTDIMNKFLEAQNVFEIQKLEKRSPLIIYLTFSFMFAIIGSCLVFPSFRYASMYNKALKTATIPVKVLLHTTFMLPILILTLFTTPVKSFLTNENNKYVLTEHQFELFRMSLIVIWSILRISLRKLHLQAYLNLGLENAVALKKSNGNISASSLVLMIQQYFLYFCVVCLQYLIPVILTICVTLLYKNLGDICLFSETCPGSESVSTSIEQNTGFSLILQSSVQIILWRYCLFMVIFTNVSFSILGIISKVYFEN